MSATPTDLFPSAVSESPRLAWLRRHGLIVREYQHPHSLNGSQRWLCANRAMTRYCVADTEDAVEQRYCELFGIAWWKLAVWNEAMAAREDCDYEKAHKKEAEINYWRPNEPMAAPGAQAEEEMELA